jgi:hypothetical protein
MVYSSSSGRCVCAPGYVSVSGGCQLCKTQK